MQKETIMKIQKSLKQDSNINKAVQNLIVEAVIGSIGNNKRNYFMSYRVIRFE
jgi:hypothetical protein